jgi:hypothetical protein
MRTLQVKTGPISWYVLENRAAHLHWLSESHAFDGYTCKSRKSERSLEYIDTDLRQAVCDKVIETENG